jgi:hypothetical protein
MKTEGSDARPPSSRAASISLKKEKPRNTNLPGELFDSGKWCSRFLPSLIYSMGNSKYPWTIPEDFFGQLLADIHGAIYPGRLVETEPDSNLFELVGPTVV